MLEPAERMPARAAWEKLSNSSWIEPPVSDGLGVKPDIAKARKREVREKRKADSSLRSE
jgi:hypothetical protein